MNNSSNLVQSQLMPVSTAMKNSLAGIVGIIVGQFLGILIFILAIPALIGYLSSNRYMKRTNINDKLIKFLAWSNILTWILPFLGVFTGFWTVRAGTLRTEDKIKYWILGNIGIIFSVLNAYLGYSDLSASTS